MEKAQGILQQTKQLKDKIEGYNSLVSQYEDLMTIIEMGNEEDDASMVAEAEEVKKNFLERFEELRISTLLTGPYDKNNAIVTLHPGAGGTEACDWVSMLYRMYSRWVEKQGYTFELLDYLDGDEAGIKSVTFMVKGENAFGYLKSEKGVHRLVRISPFDSSGRRHTSFASCEVMPELDDTIEVDINPDDIKMDVFRASGNGGQCVNTTDSAVRLTHYPTGIVISCQDEKSQLKNKEKALKVLMSRLYDLEQQKQHDEIASERKSQIGRGNRNERIRTYNYPQGRVTDHRIGLTLHRLDSIIDGDLDEIMDALITTEQAEKLKAGDEAM